MTKRNPAIPEHDMRYVVHCTDCTPTLKWIAHTEQAAQTTAAHHTHTTGHHPTHKLRINPA